MNEAEAREAYLAIAAALTRVGFGWVVEQVEAAQREGAATSHEDRPVPREVRPAHDRLVALLVAIEAAYFQTAGVAERLIEATARIQERGAQFGDFARWTSDELQPAYKVTDLWPFELGALRETLWRLRDEVGE